MTDAGESLDPDFAWARSGAMALTGHADGPPLLAPAPVASAAEGAVLALRRIAGADWRGGDLDGARLLGERAATFGFTRQGPIAPGGSCRMVECADGWLAINLARESDREMVPAWLEIEPRSDPWKAIESEVKTRSAAGLVDRARLMGLPISPVTPGHPLDTVSPWFAISHRAQTNATGSARAPVVVDLSGLWAGPLCGHLLSLACARVIKVESLERPDGARMGDADFFDLLNAGKESVAIDFQSSVGRRQLEALLDRADIVIESARPRALEQLGIDAAEWVVRKPGLVWVSITGYGRSEPEASWVAFGDDAAAAAGLGWATSRANEAVLGADPAPVFCADAIADPLTGMHAAVAALACFKAGSGGLLDLSLCGVARSVLALAKSSKGNGEAAFIKAKPGGEFFVHKGAASQRVCAPEARRITGKAREFGADNEAVLSWLGLTS